MSYLKGDYYVSCYRCRRKRLRSDVVLDGVSGDVGSPQVYVCKESVDGVHPQRQKRPQVRDIEIPAQLLRPRQVADRAALDSTTDVWGSMTGLVWGSTALTWGSGTARITIQTIEDQENEL